MIRLVYALSVLALVGCSSVALSDPSLALSGPPSAGAAGSGAAPANAAGANGTAGTAGGSAPSAEWMRYPPGPYGNVAGATIDNLSFLGWHDPVGAGYDPTQLELVQLADFYDPSGSHGIKLVAINVSAVWCSVCRAEYQDFLVNRVYDTYRAKGVQLLGTLFEDNNYYPARPSDLVLWGSVKSHQVAFPLVLDPGFKMGAYFTSDATPLNMLVDARTMKIVQAAMGYTPDYWSGVDALLSKL